MKVHLPFPAIVVGTLVSPTLLTTVKGLIWLKRPCSPDSLGYFLATCSLVKAPFLLKSPEGLTLVSA